MSKYSFRRKTWVGVCGGLGAAVIGGGAAYGTVLFNLADLNMSVPCVIYGPRLGLVAHGGVGVTIAFVTGMRSHAQLKNGLSSGGFDFAIDIAGRWGEVLKGTLRGAEAAKEASFGARLLTAVNDSKELKKFLGEEVGKNAIEYLCTEHVKANMNIKTGNLSVSRNKPNLAMVGSPIGIGAGVGVWYEWQYLAAYDSVEAWRYAPISWRLKKHGGDIWVQAKGIPASDGTKLKVFGRQIYGWLEGLFNGNINFGLPNGRGRGIAYGRVEGGKLVESRHVTDVGAKPPEGGLNLSRRYFSASRNPLTQKSTAIEPDKIISMGLKFCNERGACLWQSAQSSPVFLDGSWTGGRRNLEIQQKSPSTSWLI